MSKKCPSCGHNNDNSRIFCSACGDPLDVELRLIQELEKRKHDAGDSDWHGHEEKDTDDDYVAPVRSQDKDDKKSVLPVLLVVLAVVAAAAWFFLK